LPKTNRAYKSAKRNRELDRLRKQEEKRKRRLGVDETLPEDGEAIPGTVPDADPNAPAPADPDAPDSGEPA